MKPFTQKTILLGMLILGCLDTSMAIAEDPSYPYLFDKPSEYCVPITSFKIEDKLFYVVRHNQFISEKANDQYVFGNIFVTLRLKSKPHIYWMYQEGVWHKYAENDTGKAPVQYNYHFEAITLVSVILPLSNKLPAIKNGDWELYVGYGLRNNETSTIQDSYQDMINNGRNKLVWEFGGQNNDTRQMCMTVSGAYINDDF